MRSSTLMVAAIVGVTGLYVGSPLWTESANESFHFVVWGMPFEDRLFEDGYARDFEALHPGLEVRYDRYSDIIQKYYAWHLRGTGADVLRLEMSSYHGLVSRGVLAPIDSYLDDPELGIPPSERADFPPSVWSALEVDGQRYALPSDHNLYGLFWNRTLFEQYDAAHPDAPIGVPGPEWTWSDLVEAADALTVRDADGRIVQYGIDFGVWEWPFYTFLYQAGGRIWDAAGTTTLIDSPEGAEALTLLTELLGHAPSVRVSATSQSATGPDKIFASGRTAMFLDGSWRIPALELANPDLDFAVAPLPRGRVEAAIGTSVVWAVGAHAEDKRLAWEMVRWMTNTEQSLRYWDVLRVAPPGRLSVIAGPGFEATAGIVEPDGTVIVPPMPAERFEDRAAWLRYGLLQRSDGSRPPAFIPTGPYHRDLNRILRRTLARAVSPNRTETPADLLREATEQIHGIIDRDRKARGLSAVVR